MPGKLTPERLIQAAIHFHLGQRRDVRLFRNNQVTAVSSRGQVFKAGLGTGTADLIGWVTVNTLAGRVAIFLAVEVKNQRGQVTQAQQHFLDTVRSMGGCGILARSVTEAENALDTFIASRTPASTGETHATQSHATP